MELPSLLLLIVGLLAVGQIGLAIFLWVSEKEFLAELARVLGIPQQKKQSWSLWHQSMKKAQAVLGQAELEGVKVVADSKFYTAKLEGVYDDQFRKSAVAAQQEFGRFLAGLGKDSEKIVDEAMIAFTKRLEEKLAEVEQSALQEEKNAKEEVATYKKQMVDKARADMGEILGQVTQTVLGKKLTFTDQAELISEALEQAKKEKFI